MTIEIYSAIYPIKDKHFYSVALINWDQGGIGFVRGISCYDFNLTKVIALSQAAKHVNNSCHVTYVTEQDLVNKLIKDINKCTGDDLISTLISGTEHRESKAFFKRLVEPLLPSNCVIQFREPNTEQDQEVQNFCMQLAESYASGKKEQEIKNMINGFIAKFTIDHFSDFLKRCPSRISDCIEVESDVEQ